MSGAALRLLALLGVLALGAALSPARAQEATPAAPPSAAAASAPAAALPGLPAALDQRAFLQILAVRNADIRYSRLGAQAQGHLSAGESALYEPVVFASLRQEGRQRQRTFEERLQNLQTASQDVLNEQVGTQELGVRNRLPTGGELSASYRMVDRQNNLIALSNNTNEYSGSLVISLKQPLLRGFGRDITETDRKVADLEYALAREQLQQQLQKSGADGLAAYWQAYKAQETVRWRRASIENTRRLIADTQSRIDAGRVPASALLELRSVLLNREAELLRAQQAHGEARIKLLTVLDLPEAVYKNLQLGPRWNDGYELPSEQQATEGAALESALAAWGPLRQAQLKREQAEVRLAFAANQIKPQVDLVMSYSGTGLGYQRGRASDLAVSTRYPDWFIGLNVELPAYGNDKARAQYRAQAERRDQAEIEAASIRLGFANDFHSRWLDVKNAADVLENSRVDHKLREQIDNVERERYNLGTGSLAAVIQKEAEMVEAALRTLDSQVRYEVALSIWQYVRGELMGQAGVTVD